MAFVCLCSCPEEMMVFLDCISLAREEKRCEGRGRQEPAQGERWPRCAKPGFGVGAMSAAWLGALRLPK